MELENHVRQHRTSQKLTQQQLAEAVGVSRQTIIAIEKGKYTPSVKLALQIARHLGLTVDELFYLSRN